MSSTTIEDLPEPIIEYILSYLSPYRDLKQCMLVNKNWQRHVYDVVRKTQRDFNSAITNMSIQWSHMIPDPGPTISKRYSHSACCVGESMFVFGGCTTASTTFNDLWRLDLGTRCWIRPLATGTYPPPKACASLVHYGDNLILFGGWTHTSPYPLHQVWRVFNQLHMYNINTNRWSLVPSSNEVPAMAGHCATVHGDLMVVFGGIHRKSSEGSFTGIFTSSSDVWTLNLKTFVWNKQETTSVKPPPRYGHSQIYYDKEHILIIGGCGGPNRLFSDVWLLTMNDEPGKPWEWQEMNICNREYSAPHLAFHAACKVGKHVVVMSKGQKSRTNPSSLYLIRNPSRTWIPPRDELMEGIEGKVLRQPPDVELCVNGKRGVLKRHFERQRQASASYTSSSDDDESQDSAKKLASPSLLNQCKADLSVNNVNSLEQSRMTSMMDQPSSSHSVSYQSYEQLPRSSTSSSSTSSENSLSSPNVSSPNETAQSSKVEIPSFAQQKDSSSPRSVLSVKPNARRNRQRQLESLDRMEQRLRNLRTVFNREHLYHQDELQRFPLSMGHRCKSSFDSGTTNNPMTLYVLDISKAVCDGIVTWLTIKNQSASAPDEIVLYSFVLGRGEMIMFGGVHKDLKQHQEGEYVPEVVSNSLHFMSAERYII